MRALATARQLTDPKPQLIYPVYGREGTVAWFADYYAAVDFVNAEAAKRCLFIGESQEMPA